MNNIYHLSDFDGTRGFDLGHPTQHTDNTEEDQNEIGKTYDCTYPGCDKNFRYRSEILRHMVTHTNQRPYVCPYKDCQKAFKRSDALATHIRIHTGDKPYRCPVGSCQLSFSTKAGLRYHVLKHKNDKVFKCDFPGCDQSFLTLSQLKQHNRGAKVHDVLLSPKTQDSEPMSHSHNHEHIYNHNNGHHDFSSPRYTTSEYEPSVEKRTQFEQPQMRSSHQPTSSQQIHQLSLLSINVKTPHADKVEAEPSNLTSLLPLTTQAMLKGSHHAVFPKLQSLGISENIAPTTTLNMKYNYKETTVDNGEIENIDEQGKLLKKINKILDENTTLKKNLEICQKIINIYQTNMGAQNPPLY